MLACLLAASLAALAFVTTGGVDVAPNTWAEIVLTVIGAALAITVVWRGAPARAWGAPALIAFAALTVLAAVSISWSVQPDDSWLEANRTLSYLAAFGGAIALARLFPERWPAIVGAIALLATILCGYAILVKVFPAALDRGNELGRMRAPFGYWNATGLSGALGLPACLWLGARRDRGRLLRGLAVPAISIQLTVLVLSYSRSALLAAVVALALWFAVVPLRLRAALVLVLGAAGGAAMIAWGLATHALTRDRAVLAARSTAGHGFGVLVVLVVAVMVLVGVAAVFAMDRAEWAQARRRRIGALLLAVVALAPVAGLGALAASSRGFTGEVSHIWSTLTSAKPTVGDNPGRLVEVSNTRPLYWSEGLDIARHSLLKGVGAGAYGTARLRYATDHRTVGHAHSYVIETLADLGLLGIAVNLALLLAWGVAAVRSTRLRRLSDADPERVGLLTLLAVVVVFGVQSAVDWTWSMPGVAVPALLCAGWLAGRGPLRQREGLLAQSRGLRRSPGGIAIVLAILTGTVLAAWAIWQPLRAVNADGAAIAAISNGNATLALSDGRAARTDDPLSVDPLFELSAIYTALGNNAAAVDELRQAVRLQPANPDTWLTLGLFYVHRNQTRAAYGPLSMASRLNPSGYVEIQLLTRVRAELRRLGAAAVS